MEFDIQEILEAEPDSRWVVSEANGMKWDNVQYKGESFLHGKLFLIFINDKKKSLSINISYLSSISNIIS